MKKRQLTVLDILYFVEWKDVKRAIKYYYPDDKNDYQPVFESLKTRKTKKITDFKLVIETFGMFYYDLCDVNDCGYGISFRKKGEKYRTSVSFAPWGDVINTPIDSETLEHHTPVDIVAHVLWEITFYGNEKDMEKARKEIFSSAKKAIKDINKRK